MKISAIILAAGSGTRMGNVENKQFISIDGESVIRRSVRAFENCDSISDIVVVCKESELDRFRTELGNDFVKLSSLIVGGKSRLDSAKIGFSKVENGADFVAIHDGARCLITPDAIDKIVEAAKKYGAATAASKVTDTIKQCDENGKICATVPRRMLYSAQTPQVFSYELYKRALSALPENHPEITDDNMLLELIGADVYVVDTGLSNIKITTPNDVSLAELLVKKRCENE